MYGPVPFAPDGGYGKEIPMTRNRTMLQVAVSNCFDTTDGSVDRPVADLSNGGMSGLSSVDRPVADFSYGGTPWSTPVDRTEVVG